MTLLHHRQDLSYFIRANSEPVVPQFNQIDPQRWQPYKPSRGIDSIPAGTRNIWLRLPVDEIGEPNHYLTTIHCPSIAAVYQGSALRKSFGRYSPDDVDSIATGKIWPIIELHPKADNHFLYIKIIAPANAATFQAKCQFLALGTEYQTIATLFQIQAGNLLFGLVFLILGFLTAGLFLAKRYNIILEFAALSILSGLAFLGGTEISWFLAGIGRSWWVSWQFFTFSIPIPFLLFSERIIQTRQHVFRKLAIFHTMWVITYVASIFLDLNLSYREMREFHVYILIAESLIFLPLAIYGIVRPKPHSRILGISFLIFSVASLYDLFVMLQHAQGASLSQWALLVMFGSCVWILIQLYLDREKQIQEAQTASLRHYNEKLEDEVRERTKALESKTEALVKANRELADKNLLFKSSNRKMEDLIYKKNLILNKVEAVEQKNLRNLKKILETMTSDFSASFLKQANFEVNELIKQLKPLTSFYRSEKAIENKRILLIESDKKQQKLMKMALAGNRIQVDIRADPQVAIRNLKGHHNYDVLIINPEAINVAEAAYNQNPEIEIIMMITENIANYIDYLREHDFISNIVFKDSDDPAFTTRNLLTTISKILNQDFFGLEKYLSWGVEVQQLPIKSSSERKALIDQVVDYLEDAGVRRSIVNKVTLVADELLMNAIYDAPADDQGRAKYNYLARTSEVHLLPDEYGQFRYAFDGVLFAISAEDPFGRLTRKTILDYLKTCFEGDYGMINRSKGKGGGGMGIYQILATADLVIVNVKKEVKTEFIAIFNVMLPRKNSRDIKSFHYFAC
jgi:hypothetical protein